MQSNVWASVRVGREPVGDFLAVAEGLQNQRNRAVMQDLIERLNYIGRYLVTDADRGSYRTWLRSYFTPIMNSVGWEPKPGESDEQKALRARVLTALGYDAGDPKALQQARKIADEVLENPASVGRDLAFGAVRLAAMNGDQAFYDKLMAAVKNAKSPEQYYMYLLALSQFSNPKLLEQTLELCDLSRGSLAGCTTRDRKGDEQPGWRKIGMGFCSLALERCAEGGRPICQRRNRWRDQIILLSQHAG